MRSSLGPRDLDPGSTFELAGLFILALPVLLPGAILPLAWHGWLLVLLILPGFVRWVVTAQTTGVQAACRTASPASLPLWLLLFWLPVNVWAASDRPTALIAAGYLLWGIALYGALVHWPLARVRPWLVAGLLLLGVTALAVVAPVIIFWKPEFRLFYLPLYDQLQSIHLGVGETIHANILAAALVIALPLLLSLTLFARWPGAVRWRAVGLRLLCTLALLYMLALVILTQSRGGYLAALCGMGTVLLVRWRRLVFAIFPLAFGALFVAQWIDWSRVLDLLSSDSSLGGWSGRLEIWQRSLDALHDFALTGIGIGTFQTVIPLLYPLHVHIESYPHAHNLLLQIGMDLGIPGLIAYLALLINLLVMLFLVLRSQPTASLCWVLATGALGSLVAIAVHGLLDAAIWNNKMSSLAWLLYGLITLLFLQKENVDLRNPTYPSQVHAV